MKRITQEELEVFLRKHKLWLENKPGGERANLRYANLRSANLSYANLRSADLRDANLRDANLRSADLEVRHPQKLRTYLDFQFTQ